MQFNSIEFLGFFAAVVAAHWCLPARWRPFLLLAASYVFYASWDWRWLALLLAVTGVTYAAGLGIAACADARRRRLWLWAAVAGTMGSVAAFKAGASLSGWIVPVGLSYYSFMALGYVIDVYRGGEPTRQPLHHALFLAFFPQILAGPVERAARVTSQLRRPAGFSFERLSSGCFLIGWGLFQKVFVADNLGGLVDRLLDGRLQPDGSVVLLGVYAFALQLYADFAGYSDVAVGAARCLGLDLTPNFDRPFLAVDMREFWKRWHMSLTGWFMDYLYRPLLELRLPLKLYWAPVLTMTLMGLWHRFAAPTALMGAYYGLLLAAVLYRRSSGPDAPTRGPAAWAGRVLTFHLVAFGFMLMRVPTVDALGELLRGLSRGPWLSPDAGRFVFWLAWFGWPVALVHALPRPEGRPHAVLALPVPVRAALYVAMFYAVMVFGNDETRDFIYLQF